MAVVSSIQNSKSSQNNGPRIFLNLDLPNTEHGHALRVNMTTKKRGGEGGVKPTKVIQKAIS
jgi:hypothetical protein